MYQVDPATNGHLMVEPAASTAAGCTVNGMLTKRSAATSKVLKILPGAVVDRVLVRLRIHILPRPLLILTCMRMPVQMDLNVRGGRTYSRRPLTCVAAEGLKPTPDSSSEDGSGPSTRSEAAAISRSLRSPIPPAAVWMAEVLGIPTGQERRMTA